MFRLNPDTPVIWADLGEPPPGELLLPVASNRLALLVAPARGSSSIYHADSEEWSELAGFYGSSSQGAEGPGNHTSGFLTATIVGDTIYAFPSQQSFTPFGYINELWKLTSGDAAWSLFSTGRDTPGLQLTPYGIDHELYLVGDDHEP